MSAKISGQLTISEMYATRVKIFLKIHQWSQEEKTRNYQAGTLRLELLLSLKQQKTIAKLMLKQ